MQLMAGHRQVISRISKGSQNILIYNSIIATFDRQGGSISARAFVFLLPATPPGKLVLSLFLVPESAWNSLPWVLSFFGHFSEPYTQKFLLQLKYVLFGRPIAVVGSASEQSPFKRRYINLCNTHKYKYPYTNTQF